MFDCNGYKNLEKYITLTEFRDYEYTIGEGEIPLKIDEILIKYRTDLINE
jgi:hypothetical protein